MGDMADDLFDQAFLNELDECVIEEDIDHVGAQEDLYTDRNIYERKQMSNEIQPYKPDDRLVAGVDTMTGEIVPVRPQNVSMLILSDEEKVKLDKAKHPPIEQIEWREGGNKKNEKGVWEKVMLAYLPQVFYRETLNDIFGAGAWSLLEVETAKEPKVNDKNEEYFIVFFHGHLYVRGCFVASACGEAKYYPANGNSTFASAYESAKSDCITRCCKDLGIASDLWKPEFLKTLKQGTPAIAPTAKPVPKKENPKDEPTQAEIDTAHDKIEYATSTTDLQKVWGEIPADVKPYVLNYKEKRKLELA